MATARPKKAVGNSVPSVKGWGGVRNVVQRIERSQTIVANREAVAYSLLTMANTKITDIFEWDKVQVLRILAKASGLLDTPDDGQKPSVIGVNIHAPEDIEPKEVLDE